MRDIMIDVETLSTRPDAMIIAIGAVAFDAKGLGAELHYTITLNTARGHIDPETVAWWMEQSEEARAVFRVGSTVPQSLLTHVLSELRRFIFAHGSATSRRIWGHGSSFDLPIIENAYREVGDPIPWGYRAPRDTRTILDLAGITVATPEGMKHNALEDAKAQALAVIEAAHVLGAHRLWPELGA